MPTDLRNDELDTLVAQARSGQRPAFRALFDATYREVRLFVAARAPSEEMVDEVVQSAYVVAFESLADYRPGNSFAAWLKGIARNLMLREFQRRGRLEPLASLGQPPAPEAVIDDLGGRIDGCLERLSPTARALVGLRYLERLPVQEIAKRLGRTASSVSVSLHRIRATLATCLGPEVMDHV